MKKTRFKLKKIITTPASAGVEARTTLILSPENYNGGQQKIEVLADEDAASYQKGDHYDLTLTKVKGSAKTEKVKAEEVQPESEEASALAVSTDMHVPEALEYIASLDSKEEVREFIKGDDRVSVNEAAKDRIKEIREEEK